MRLGVVLGLAGSAVLGLGALAVARLWIPSVENARLSAEAATLRSAEDAANRRTTPVVVAAQPLAYGVKLEAKNLTIARLPKDAAPVGAYASIDQVLGADQGEAPVVLAPIAEREALLPAKLSGPGARPTVSAEIEKGMRAYAIHVSDTAGVGGHALPGDRVDVMLLRNLNDNGVSPDFPHNQPPKLVADVVLQNVKVLGVDLNADPNSTAPHTPSTAVLQVDVRDAQKLAVAAQLGTLSLALRRTGQADTEPTQKISARDVAGDASAVAPPGRRAGRPGRVHRQPAAADTARSVTIINGSRPSPVRVISQQGAGA